MIDAQLPKILKSLPERISDVVGPWASRMPDHPALVETSGTWTYRQLASAVEHARKLLIQSGVRAGDRVLLVCENCRAHVAVLLAVASLNAWPVLVNARLSPQEIDQIRDHSGARRVIYMVSASPHALKHAKRHNAQTQEFLTAGSIAIGELNQEVLPEALDAETTNNVGHAHLHLWHYRIAQGSDAQPQEPLVYGRNLFAHSLDNSRGSSFGRPPYVSCCRPFNGSHRFVDPWSNALFIFAI